MRSFLRGRIMDLEKRNSILEQKIERLEKKMIDLEQGSFQLFQAVCGSLERMRASARKRFIKLYKN